MVGDLDFFFGYGHIFLQMIGPIYQVVVFIHQFRQLIQLVLQQS